MAKVLKSFLAVAILNFTLVGCSTSSPDSTAIASMSPNAEDENSKSFIIVTDTAFKPFEYTDTEGNFVGIDVDILAAIAKDQGFTYILKSIGFDSSISACKSSKADGVIAGISITDEREESGWIFSDSYFTSTQCVATNNGSDIKTLNDLKDKIVVVKKETQGQKYAKSIKDKYGFNIIEVDDSSTMYQYVLNGQANACFEDTPVIKALIAEGNFNMEIIANSENEGSNYALAIFSNDKQELVDLFNEGLKNIKDSGKYDEIINKYLD